MSIVKVNKILKERGIVAELVKAKGYFYFVGRDVEFCESTSVMVTKFSQLSVDQWVREAEHLVKESGMEE